MGVGDVNMKCAGDVAKGYALAWVRLRVLGIRGRFLQRILLRTKRKPCPESGTQIRTQAALRLAARGWPAECIGGIAGAALCDMEITLCNCTYVQFFL